MMVFADGDWRVQGLGPAGTRAVGMGKGDCVPARSDALPPPVHCEVLLMRVWVCIVGRWEAENDK